VREIFATAAGLAKSDRIIKDSRREDSTADPVTEYNCRWNIGRIRLDIAGNSVLENRMKSRLTTLVCLAIALPVFTGSACPPGPDGGGAEFPKDTAWQLRTINGDAGSRPAVVATADFDADGRRDVLVAYDPEESAQSRVVILFQNAIDNFAAVRIGEGANLDGVAALAIADLDGDEHRDVVAACNGRLVYLHSPANPREASGWTASIIDESSGASIGQWNDVAVGPIDGAHGPDIVACNAAPGRLSWFRSPASDIANGTGWTRVDIDATTRTNAASVALADLNADNRLDVVSTAPGESAARIAWYRNPSAPVSDTWNRFAIGNLAAATRLVLADLNADGRSDCLALNGPGRQIGWYVRPTNATGDWSGYLLTAFTSYTPVDLAAEDLDGNTQIDVVVATRNGNTFRWFTPVGVQTRQWVENNLADLGFTPGRFVLADLNADGRTDVIAPLRGATTAQDQVAWFENPE